MSNIHKVKCVHCGVVFDRDKEPFVQVSARRYAHKECGVAAQTEKTQEQIDKEKLEQYIMELLKEDYVNPRVRKQLNEFVEKYKYTYSGMLKALVYFYEVKGNDKTKANGGVGIIPYVYTQAYQYYYSLWLAQQVNEDKVISDYTPDVVEVIIPVPQLKKRRTRFFKFFEEDE